MIDITGIDKGLFVHFLLRRMIPVEIVRMLLCQSGNRFEATLVEIDLRNHQSQCLKTVTFDVSGDEFDPTGYDDIYGPGSAAKVADLIRYTSRTLEDILRSAGINPDAPPPSTN
jgi:hypothetical protein